MGAVKGTPKAVGLNRTADHQKAPLEILRWGLTHEFRSRDDQYIRGFRTRGRTNQTLK